MATVGANPKAEKKENEDTRTPDEKKLFELIEKGSNDSVIAHVKATKVKIDCLDPRGMTPLQLAAFRGNKELCEFFLANGADVNSNHHENSYSALMFASLSGKPDVTKVILEAGANTQHINSVNRTAAQMAAFVGQHQCVSVINNFFPQSEIDYFTKPQGLEKEAKLPSSCASALCTLINFSNVHPVKISMYLRDHPELLTESTKVCLVLSRLVERSMKSREINDILALKCHLMYTLVKMAAQAREKDKAKSVAGWLKSLMKGRDSDGFQEFQERLIRQSLKDFPYPTSALLQQLVRQIAPVKIGDDPTALSLLISAVNGQQYAWDASEGCSTCGEAKAEAKCAKCKMVKYCNQDCQRLHWPMHKKFCAELAEEFVKLEEQRRKEEEREKKEKEEAEKKKKEEREEAAAAESIEKDESKENVFNGAGDGDCPPEKVNGEHATGECDSSKSATETSTEKSQEEAVTPES